MPPHPRKTNPFRCYLEHTAPLQKKYVVDSRQVQDYTCRIQTAEFTENMFIAICPHGYRNHRDTTGARFWQEVVTKLNTGDVHLSEVGD